MYLDQETDRSFRHNMSMMWSLHTFVSTFANVLFFGKLKQSLPNASLPQPASQSSSTQLEVPETSAGSAEVHVQERCLGWSRHQSGTASDLSRTPALNKVSWTACQGARPTHSGPQDRSELCVQKAVRTSGHCDITVQGGSLESSNPFNIVRGEGRSMFLKVRNNC